VCRVKVIVSIVNHIPMKKPVLTISNYETHVNRTTKLKQCKLDVQQEQWLFQRSQGESLLCTHILILHMLIGAKSTKFQRS
jgi:hypothetical protein